MSERLAPVNIIDILSDTDHWLEWTRHFGPLSGHEAKIENPRGRYIATTFCYGCNLGPTQTARSLKGPGRRQVSLVNQRHATDGTLEKANVEVINAYNRVRCQFSGWRTRQNVSDFLVRRPRHGKRVRKVLQPSETRA
jgi:hypothetical protein